MGRYHGVMGISKLTSGHFEGAYRTQLHKFPTKPFKHAYTLNPIKP